ncbi:MAG: alpha/beta hydrolase [Acidimicrobiales bacterium]|nr:alpha/beta hydrolase [Acidimicrobiales bacterium]
MTTAALADVSDDVPATGSDATQSPPWWHPENTVAKVTGAARGIERRLARQPLARLSLAAPRTARYVIGEMFGEDVPGVPPARLTPALVGQVLMDESIMAVAVGPNRFPRRDDYVRVGGELTEAHALFEKRGWLEDPASYHRTPPPLDEPAVTRGWALGHSYERIWWPSAYSPHEGVPGSQRWLSIEPNRTASAWLLRHRDHSRPWVVCVHGLGTGSVFMDLFSFRAAYLHEELGLNVAAIVLPAHGARRRTRFSGEEFLGFDLMNSVHGLTQAVWDVRRLVGWVRRQDPAGVGLFGVSLGGLVAGLVAAFEPDLDMVLAGIPIVDFPDLIEHHAPRHLLMRSIEHNILNGTAQEVHRVVSPLALPVVAPPESLAVFAGLGDRLATTEPARRLAEHWGSPEACWYPGNHVGYLWSGAVWQFVTAVLERRGLTA